MTCCSCILLKNRITFLYIHRPNTKTCSAAVFVKFGSKYEESTSKFGVAHFVEHMLFKGTNKWSCKEISELVEGRGGEMNAYTSRHNTLYYIASVRKEISLASDILLSIVKEANLSKSDFDVEKRVILEEVNTENDNSDQVACNLYNAYIYFGSTLGMPVGGTCETVSRIRHQDIIDCYSKNYCGSNITVGISGDFSKSIIDEMCSKWETVTSGLESEYIAFESSSIPVKQFKHIKRNFSQNYIFLFNTAPTRQDTLATASKVLNTIFGIGSSSRLYRAVREKSGLAYYIYSRISHTDSHGLWTVYASTGFQSEHENRVAQCIQSIKGVIESIYKTGISKKEFVAAKKFLLGSLIHSNETALGNLENALYFFDRKNDVPDEVNMINEINDVTYKDVNTLIKNYFNPEDWGIFIVGASDGKCPT